MDDKILKKNIKYLMATRGLTQKDIAEILHYEGANSISQWLNDRNIPDEVVEKLANYFEISVLMLKFYDIEENTNFINNDEIFDEYLKILFPYEVNKEALENEKFNKAFKIHMDYLKYQFPESKEKAYEKALECYRLYKGAYEEGIIEGLINMISISSLYKMILKTFNFDLDIDEIKIEDDIDSMNENEKRKLFKQLAPYNNDKSRKEIKNFLIASSEEIYDILFKLKNKENMISIADYYLAILYSNNFLYSEFQESDNMQFGWMYLDILYKMKNEYSIKAIDFFDKHQNDNKN